jgi:hypothetical protein
VTGFSVLNCEIEFSFFEYTDADIGKVVKKPQLAGNGSLAFTAAEQRTLPQNPLILCIKLQ